jgi:hypothetical protein
MHSRLLTNKGKGSVKTQEKAKRQLRNRPEGLCLEANDDDTD